MGQLDKGLQYRQGMNLMILESGQVEEGYFYNGVQHGPWRCIYPLGGYFQGMAYEEMKHGYGTYVSYKGDQYKGYYKENVRHAEGRKIFIGSHENEIHHVRYDEGDVSETY